MKDKDKKTTVCGQIKAEDRIRLDQYCQSIGWSRSQLVALIVNWYIRNHDKDHAIRELLK